MPITHKEIEQLMNGIAGPIGEAMARSLAPLKKQLADLERRYTEIETRGIKYRGVFQIAETYSQGDVVTAEGSMWCAVRVTRDKPGKPESGWALTVKSGKDGKDWRR